MLLVGLIRSAALQVRAYAYLLAKILIRTLVSVAWRFRR